MTEDDARDWLARRFGEAVHARCAHFVDLVVGENERQNLVAPGSVDKIWTRHVVDSAQLVAHAPAGAATWLDIGTGGGFPGVVVALCWPGTVTLVEPRRKRAAFLADAVAALGLGATVSVQQCRVEVVHAQFDVISARAVASVEKLLQAARHCATPTTRWILPRGQTSIDEEGGGMFHVEHSITDPASRIMLIDGMGS